MVLKGYNVSCKEFTGYVPVGGLKELIDKLYDLNQFEGCELELVFKE